MSTLNSKYLVHLKNLKLYLNFDLVKKLLTGYNQLITACNSPPEKLKVNWSKNTGEWKQLFDTSIM